MSNLSKKILEAKFEAVLDNLQHSFGYHTSWRFENHVAACEKDTLAILEQAGLQDELGPLYKDIFTHIFTYDHGDGKNPNILAGMALKYGAVKLSQHALTEMEGVGLLGPKMALSLLETAIFGRADDANILKLIELIPSEMIKQREEKAKSSLIAQARKRDLFSVVEVLQQKIDYQPPVIEGGSPTKIKISFADPRAMVRAALDAQSSGLALDVGSDILHTCTKFFDEVRKRSAQSLASGLEAGNGLQKLAVQADEARKALKEISANPEKLRVPDGIMGKLTLAVRAIVPALDPHKKLDHDFGDAIDTTKRTYDLSKSVVKAYEDFKNHYPQINGEIDNLVAALDEGVAEIDAKGEITPDLAELKTVFMAIASNARTMSVITAQNLASVEMMKTTEVQFAISVLNTQTAFAAISTDMSLSLAHMKASAVPEIQQMAEQEVITHMQRAEKTLTGLRQLIDDRQNNIVSLMPALRQRTLEAA